MAQWIVGFIEQHGYVAIAALMLLENVFPPVPSELIMPFAGFAAARGELNVVLAVLAGAGGSLAGTLPWYWLGRSIGDARLKRWAAAHGRLLTVSPEDLERANRWFDRHGAAAVFLGRLVPGLRSVVSAPAGICRMPMRRFLLWSAAGSFFWCSALAGLGLVLEARHDAVARWLDPLTWVVLAIALGGYAWRVIAFRPRSGDAR